MCALDVPPNWNVVCVEVCFPWLFFFLKCAITKIKIFTSLPMKFQCQLFLSSNGIFLCAAGELFSLGIGYKTVFNTENNKQIITAVYFLVKKFPCVQR